MGATLGLFCGPFCSHHIKVPLSFVAMAVGDDGETKVLNVDWFAAVKDTVRKGNLVLLLVQRKEGGKDKNNTHYVVIMGFEEETTKVRRKEVTMRSVWLKDPMEGDQLLRADFWPELEPDVELVTYQHNSSSKLDRFGILEAHHLQRPQPPG